MGSADRALQVNRYRMRRTRRALSTLATISCFCAVALLATAAWSHPPDNDHTHMAKQDSGTKHGSLSDVGAKLNDPTSNIWALQFQFNPVSWYDGDLNKGDAKVGSSVTFQPIMPFPLYGEGDDQWKLITRPVLPIIFSTPVPTGFNTFHNKGGLGDLTLPTMVNPAANLLPAAPGGGSWIFGLGPTWYFPTATNKTFGTQQYGVGPALVLGYKNKNFTAVTLTEYWYGIGQRSGRKTSGALSQMDLLLSLIHI